MAKDWDLPYDSEVVLTPDRHRCTHLTEQVGEYAATACVSLLGRNESGLMLSKGSVDAVLDGLHHYFKVKSEHWLEKNRFKRPARKVVPKVASNSAPPFSHLQYVYSRFSSCSYVHESLL